MATFNKILTLAERLQEIVDLSYRILCNKVAAGNVSIPNEASMQMQFGTILNSVGKLYEVDKHDRFTIELESPKEIEASAKSSKGIARCDIYIALARNKSKATAAIELKHFRKGPNEAVTDNRFFVLQDLENLEHYMEKEPKLQCYEIVYTDNLNHTINKAGLTVNIGHKAQAPSQLIYTQNREVNLKGGHTFLWDIYGSKESAHCFMKVHF